MLELKNPRTDAEIVAQTNELALLCLHHTGFDIGHDMMPDDGLKFYESESPRARAAWNRACEIMELLTCTDPNDALANIAADGSPPLTYYKVTIEVLVEVDSETEACDAISETMRPLLREFAGSDSCIIDWRHLNCDSPIPHDGSGFEYAVTPDGEPAMDGIMETHLAMKAAGLT